MNLFADAFAWLFSPDRLVGTYALPTLLGQHLLYTVVSVAVGLSAYCGCSGSISRLRTA